jgi:hypothetical protein
MTLRSAAALRLAKMFRNWIISMLSLFWATHAGAQAPPRSLSGGYSPYEEEALAAAERSVGSSRDAGAEGKLIEEVVFRRLEPIEPRDPVPTAINVIHVESRESVLRREVVLREGGRFSKVQCDESARRLRALPPLSLVMCVPLRGSTPERVKVLILTKDLWSLLVDPDFSFDGGRLLLEPKESNLLGLHHLLFVRYDQRPDQYSLGVSYTIPRFDGQFVSLMIDGNVIVNRDSGTAEGSYGAVQAQRVPRSTRDPWSWFTDVNWHNGFTRNYSGGALLKYEDPPAPPILDQVFYHSEFNATAALTRSLGWRFKSDFTFALTATRVSDRLPAPPARFSTDEQRARIGMENALLTAPHRRVGPLFEAHFYTSDFLRTYEAETLGLQEDFRLGHDVLLRALPAVQFAPPNNAFRGTEQQSLVLGTSATLQETLALGSGFARTGIQVSCDFGSGGAENTFGKAWLRVMTPRLGFGRLVEDAEASRVFDQSSKVLSSVTYSNAGRLRGYTNLSSRTAGVVNLEYRTPALQLWTEQLGGVLFYDLAGLGDPKLAWFDSVGAGVRLVTPLLERAGLRFDFAVPLRTSPDTSKRGLDAWMIQLAFGQAFGVPDVSPLKPKHLQ